MLFKEPICEAIFVKRYKRFFADVRLRDKLTVAHVPNTGSMKSCLFPDAPCLVTENSDPLRKLKATLQFIKAPTSWVGVNTALPNQLVYELWESKKILHWKKYKVAKREYKISKETRFDLALALDETHLEKREVHHIEVKNVTLADTANKVGIAMFPDAVTERGQKHLRELTKIVSAGGSAELVFVIQRNDCQRFSPADDIDPVYGKLLRKAIDAGVVVSAYGCELKIENLEQVQITIVPEPIPIKL